MKYTYLEHHHTSMKHPQNARHRHYFLWRVATPSPTIAFSTSTALARVNTARDILNLLVYLDISASGRRARITTISNRDGPGSLSGMRVKCEVLTLHALIVHETPLPRSVALSHGDTRRCAALNSCVVLANNPLMRRQVTAPGQVRRHIGWDAVACTEGRASRCRPP